MSTLVMATSAAHGPVSDVAPVLGAVEMDALGHLVGAVLRLLHAAGQNRHALHAAARSQRGPVLLHGAGMKYDRIFGRLWQAGDRIAYARVERIARSRHHDA